MKNKSGVLAAATVAAAASGTAAYSSSSCSILFTNPRSKETLERQASSKKGENSTASSEQFAPRFDGLRFIETLITAHR